MEYGLIGSNLTHSFSKYLHEEFLNTKYELKSLNKDELDLFFKKKDFKGINVTLPYKKEVIKYLDEVDEIVKRTNTCNCIINKDNKLVGYNTDYYGFKFLIEENDIIIENRKIAILGSGGTFSTIKALMNDLNAKEVYCISRNKKEDTYIIKDKIKNKDYFLVEKDNTNFFTNDVLKEMKKKIHILMKNYMI